MNPNLGGRLGKFLMTKGLVTEAQMAKALDLQRSRGLPLTQILVDLGYVSTAQLAQHFPQLSLIENVQDQELSHFADSFIHRRHPKGEILFRQGEIGHEAFVILQGVVRVERHQDGESRTLARLSPGELLGEIALLDGDTRSATAVADSEVVEVMVLHRTAFLEQIRRNADLTLEVFKLFARRMRATNAMWDREAFGSPASPPAAPR